MKIKYSKQAEKYLKKLHRPKREQIINAIHLLPEGDVKPMNGRGNLYRLRVNDYRVIFSREGAILLITKIGSRGDIYQ